MGFHLADPITVLRGVASRKAERYAAVGITTIEELLRYLPRDYRDFRVVTALSTLELGQPGLVRATILKKSLPQRIRQGLTIRRITAVADDGTPLIFTFYNGRYTTEALREEQSYLFYGAVGGNLLRREMASPARIEETLLGTLSPIYPATAQLSSRVIAKDIRQALAGLSEVFPDPLPEEMRRALGFPTVDAAIRAIHAPERFEDCTRARGRMAFEEFLIFSVAMQWLRGVRQEETVSPFPPTSPLPFWESLPFSPTGAQRTAVSEIAADLQSGRVMNRLLQGDVGSGKTLVAAAALYLTVQAGKQGALMAPTELLAAQHAETLTRLLSPFGIEVVLLTGSLRSKEKKERLAALADRTAMVAVGTHALLSEGVDFAALGLVVTDEQHRFGVNQRARLTAKGNEVHTLVMSATPIPRTLSLILYGDLDVSLLQELPPGRIPVATYRMQSNKRQAAYGFIQQHLDAGQQAYIVCPLVGEEDNPTELRAAATYAKELTEGAFRNYRVGLLHGKQKPSEKAATMAAFRANEIQLLVATTVIEVGVDVPNATILLVENAERFGLSQLHQLRGRVGRGGGEAFCFLLSDSKNPTTLARLRVLKETNDGFRVAEEDLRLRGPGDLLGARQHGIPGLEHADFTADASLLEPAQRFARELLTADPDLSAPEHLFLAVAVSQLIGRIGERPN